MVFMAMIDQSNQWTITEDIHLVNKSIDVTGRNMKRKMIGMKLMRVILIGHTVTKSMIIVKMMMVI